MNVVRDWRMISCSSAIFHEEYPCLDGQTCYVFFPCVSPVVVLSNMIFVLLYYFITILMYKLQLDFFYFFFKCPLSQ